MSRVRSATHTVLAALAAGCFLIVTSPVVGAQQQPPGLDPLIAPIGVTPAPPADTPSRVRLDISQLTPRVVRAETTITVAGRLTNTDTRRIDDVEVRLQRGDPIASDAKLREGMTQPPAAETIKPQFQ